MLTNAEKEGLRPVEQVRMDLFRRFLDDNHFIDMELKGCKFTWLSNPREGQITKQKIDRVICNWDWLAQFSHALGVALPIINSDHSPILLKPKPPLTSGKQFKYEAFWEENVQCREVVAEGWNSSIGGQNHWENVKSKLTHCQQKFQRWSHNTFKNAAREISKLKGTLQTLLNRPSNEVDWNEVKGIRANIDRMWRQEETYWGQRSRIHWLK